MAISKSKPATEKKAASSSKTTEIPTITLKQIGADLAILHDLPKKTVESLFDDMVELVGKHLKKGSKIRISGLGIFQVKKRASRQGRNPATGEAMKIKASKTVGFKIARDLKESL
ncbi:HU family DNA-binding protein [Beijerinckia indica]|uniref:Histone family protein DNA-binding protein n=1 Tax=Beijerinckia indica subsp. indica (strain ATCC 9039 / DSM 1715 / NCIMB 8712) TaxID=395963 RepID=B2ILK2_BEII9|nr:HU family DNA-binding protein [Beijerinckia indica]ACB97402.1 histone family protein DNA-binding protein [Beijerinckia indica subsp. indica ATCC 9039]